MKLGIVVVYLVSERMGPLLDLHLRKIDRYTDVPYTIYGNMIRLPQEHRRALERHPHLQIVEGLPAYEDRDRREESGTENAYYLDHLVDAAMADGVTHLCMLHVDSFPIREGWIQHLTAKIDDSAPVAAILRLENGDTVLPMPACLFCTREFQELARPRFMIAGELERSEEFRAVCGQGRRVERDTGFGYAYALYQHGLGWHRMLRSNRYDDHYLLAGIYDDLVFHLGAAARADSAGKRLYFKRGPRGALQTPAFTAAQGKEERRRLLKEADLANRQRFEQIFGELLRDPDGYLHLLRTGRRHSIDVSQQNGGGGR